MQLQIVNDDVPLTVGSFDLDKAPQDQVRDLKRLWFEHLDLSSSTDIVSVFFFKGTHSTDPPVLFQLGNKQNLERAYCRYRKNQPRI
jgi:hypothetical protein